MSADVGYACDTDSAIVGGFDNAVGSSSHLGSSAFSVIGGGESNVVGGQSTFIGAGFFSSATGNDSFIGAGDIASVAGDGSFIGGGGYEVYQQCQCAGPGTAISSSATDSFIGAGDLNSITGSGSFIGAGGYNIAIKNTALPGNHILGVDSFIGAGDQNEVDSTNGFVGAGYSNDVPAAGNYASIIGGGRNTASAAYATVIGGYGNSASGQYAIVAGGNSDVASGILTYAAGYHAQATHNGSFVWSDYVSGSTALKDAAINEFIARASGGTTFYSNEAATSGVRLAAGSGTWANLSDRNAKAGIAPLDDEAVLAELERMPVTTWNYTTESGVRHIGPMAQDFYAAFGVGEDDRHITTVDEDGVALAAVKGLNAKLERKIHALQTRVAAFDRTRAEVVSLRAELHDFEASFAREHR